MKRILLLLLIFLFSCSALAGTAASSDIAPTIIVQPRYCSTLENTTATFSVIAGGTEPLTYQWQKEDDSYEWKDIVGAVSNDYSFTAQMSDSAGYHVVVTNKYGSVTSETVWLYVTTTGIPPTIALTDSFAMANTTAMFSATGRGTAPLTYLWQRSGDDGVTWSDINGVDAPDYLLTAQMSDHGALYRVTVSNDYGIATSNTATLTVLSADSPPMITEQKPASDDYYYMAPFSGDIVTYSVKAVGAEPLTYQWQFNYAYDKIDDLWKDINGANTSAYQFTATEDNEGQYRVMVNNDYGSVTSDVITMWLNKGIQPPPKGDSSGGCNSFMASGEMLGILLMFLALQVIVCGAQLRKNR